MKKSKRLVFCLNHGEFAGVLVEVEALYYVFSDEVTRFAFFVFYVVKSVVFADCQCSF